MTVDFGKFGVVGLILVMSLSMAIAPTVADNGGQSNEIDSCTTITQSGYYEITEDILAKQESCIVVKAQKVTIEGNNHQIAEDMGAGSFKHAIFVDQFGVEAHTTLIEIRNVSTKGFDYGINVEWSGEGYIKNNEIQGATNKSINVKGADARINISNNFVDGGRIGIHAGDGDAVINNTVKNAVVGVATVVGKNYLIADNRLDASGNGIAILGSREVSIINNTIMSRSHKVSSIAVQDVRNVTLDGNQVRSESTLYFGRTAHTDSGEPRNIGMNNLSVGDDYKVSFKGTSFQVHDVGKQLTPGEGFPYTANETEITLEVEKTTKRNGEIIEEIDGHEFRIKYRDDVVEGFNESSLEMWRYVDGNYSEVETYFVDKEENLVVFEVDDWGKYTLIGSKKDVDYEKPDNDAEEEVEDNDTDEDIKNNDSDSNKNETNESKKDNKQNENNSNESLNKTTENQTTNDTNNTENKQKEDTTPSVMVVGIVAVMFLSMAGVTVYFVVG